MPRLRVEKKEDQTAKMSSRPKSMSDFAALLDASTPIHSSERPRKKPSISLAAGLIMNSESPRTLESMSQHMNGGGLAPGGSRSSEGASNGNLFYAYAQKVYTYVPQPFPRPCFVRHTYGSKETNHGLSSLTAQSRRLTSSHSRTLLLQTNGGRSYRRNTRPRRARGRSCLY